jgi:hypothetical protein
MSEPMEIKQNKNVENHNNESIFKSSLFIQVPNNEGVDYKKRNSIDYFNTSSMTPRASDHNFKNYISSDLMRRLEESSPIKSQTSFEINRRFSELCLVSCETKNEDNDDERLANINQKNSIIKLENMNTGEENFNSSESNESKNEEKEKKQKTNGESENVINAMKNLKAKNFMLKTQIMKPQNEYFITEEESEENSQNNTFFSNTARYAENSQVISREPDSLFGNMMNFGNMKFNQSGIVSPSYNSKQNKLSRKDSSPFYSYYNDTSEYLSQNFYDDFNKNLNLDKQLPADKNIMNLDNTNNYTKKVPLNPINKFDDSKPDNLNLMNQHKKQIYNPAYNKFNLDTNLNMNMEDYTKINMMNHNRLHQSDVKNQNFNNHLGLNVKPVIQNDNFNPVYNYNKNMLTNLDCFNNNKNIPNKINLNHFDTNNSFQMKYANFNNQKEEDSEDDKKYNTFNNKQNITNNLNHPYSLGSNLNYAITNNISDQHQMMLDTMTNKETPKKGNTQTSSNGPNSMSSVPTNNQTTVSNEEDYIVEMFGRKGWICELCNNFNYESNHHK